MKRITASIAATSLLASLSATARGDAQPAPVPATPSVSPVSVVPATKPPSTPTPPGDHAPPPEGALHEPDTSRLAPFEKGIEFQPRNLADKVSFSLDDADLSELLRVMGQLTGRRFVIATTKIKGFKASVFSPQKVTVAEAYQAFLAILQANALTVLPAAGFWKVVDTLDVTRQSSVPLTRGAEPVTADERFVTRIERLAHVPADDVAANVLPKFQSRDGTVVPYAAGNLLILTDTGDNIRRMLKIIGEIDVPSAGDKVWMEPLFYVSSADMEKKLTEILAPRTSSAKPSGGAGAGASTPAPDPAGEAARLGKLVALDRPNAIVITGTRVAYERALELIKRIDVPVSSEGDIHVVALQHADAKKIVPAINEAVQGATAASAAGSPQARPSAGPLSILESKVLVSAEETTNSILVTSSDKDFAAVRDVIRKLDQPRRQVYIEAVVMDVTMKRTTDIGVQFHGADATGDGSSTLFGGMNATGSILGPSLTDVTLQAFALGVRGPSVTALGTTIPAFGALINMYARTEEADILSTPHILATDNTPAEIHVQLNTSLQQNAPSLASLGSASGSTAASSLAALGAFAAPASANYGKIGPKVKITPHLNGADEVRLEVEETISDLVGDTSVGTLGTVPFMERGATTTLTVRDQETVVIGGLVRDKVAHTTVKTPILGDIPLIGALFRHKSDTIEKSNLVLVLTPYIIREQDDLRRIFERKMEERQDFIDHSTIFSMHDWQPHKDYTRTRGLLEEIRQRGADVEERKKAEEAMRPRDVKSHEGTEPIDLGPALPVDAAPRARPGDASAPTLPRTGALSTSRAVQRIEP